MVFMILNISHPKHRAYRAGLRVAVLLAWFAMGCENPNEAFSGRWGPSESINAAESSIDLGAGDVWPQLHLGHYGLEVAGVVTFHPSDLVAGTSTDCACSFVQHRHLNLDAQTLVFTTDCRGETADWALAITRNEDDQV